MTPSNRRSALWPLCVLLTALLLAAPVQAHEPEEPPSHPNYWLPALEILGQHLLFNLAARSYGASFAQITPGSMWTNLTGPWEIDEDAFLTNQIGHPYQGALYHTAARSAQLGFWTSALYTSLGSLVWEYFWETERPSVNDQVTTAIGGVIFGEVLRRLSLVVRQGGELPPGWRLLPSLLLDPQGSINRELLGVDQIPAASPKIFAHLSLGYGVLASQDLQQRGAASVVTDKIHLSSAITYGQPGDQGYEPSEPMDHFDASFRLDISPQQILTSIFLRSLLWGGSYGGPRFRGIWGLFVGHDFFSSEELRLGAFDLSLGTSMQLRLGQEGFVRLTTTFGAVPMGGAGRRISDTLRDYHLGPGGSQLSEIQLGWADIGYLRVASRNISIDGIPYADTTHAVSQNDLTLLFNPWGRHAFGAEASAFVSYREYSDGRSQDVRSSLQLRLFYAFLFDTRFGLR